MGVFLCINIEAPPPPNPINLIFPVAKSSPSYTLVNREGKGKKEYEERADLKNAIGGGKI